MADGSSVIAVAGASGFVGQALVGRLSTRHRVIALSRQGGAADGGPVTRRACDLFRLDAAVEALQGAEVAVYLVHSMQPAARLTQASFEDLDVLCADNFARAAAKAGVRRIVYLGGLLPPGGAALSRHLRSRREVERVLAARGVPVVTLRAGLVIGPGGSSYEMMQRLARRLPVMVVPRWSRTRTQPIALRDVLALLEYAVEQPAVAPGVYDVGGPEVVTYADLLRTTARALGRPGHVYTLPVETVNLSLLWISAITGAPQALVRPLVESLTHEMVLTDGGGLQAAAGLRTQPLAAAIAEARDAGAPRPAAPAAAPRGRWVCSIQRFAMPPGQSVAGVAAAYLGWLPRFLGPLFSVAVGDDGACRFFFRPLRAPLLVLQPAPGGEWEDRVVYRVTGGLLADLADGPQARLEFRGVLEGQAVLAAVQDFSPRLPWPVYRLTQGPFHAAVMRAFGRFVEGGPAG